MLFPMILSIQVLKLYINQLTTECYFTALALEDTFYLIQFTKLFSNQIFKETAYREEGKTEKHCLKTWQQGSPERICQTPTSNLYALRTGTCYQHYTTCTTIKLHIRNKN